MSAGNNDNERTSSCVERRLSLLTNSFLWLIFQGRSHPDLCTDTGAGARKQTSDGAGRDIFSGLDDGLKIGMDKFLPGC